MKRQQRECRSKKTKKQQKQFNVKYRQLNNPKTNDKWSPGLVTSNEELVRKTWLQQRATIIKQLKVTEILYANFYRSGILSKMDKTTYACYYKSLMKGLDIVQQPQRM